METFDIIIFSIAGVALAILGWKVLTKKSASKTPIGRGNGGNDETGGDDKPIKPTFED